jgi:hypothetical protein
MSSAGVLCFVGTRVVNLSAVLCPLVWVVLRLLGGEVVALCRVEFALFVVRKLVGSTAARVLAATWLVVDCLLAATGRLVTSELVATGRELASVLAATGRAVASLLPVLCVAGRTAGHLAAVDTADVNPPGWAEAVWVLVCVRGVGGVVVPAKRRRADCDCVVELTMTGVALGWLSAAVASSSRLPTACKMAARSSVVNSYT